jgi:predicted transglutaminase-like cysteine proteinase
MTPHTTVSGRRALCGCGRACAVLVLLLPTLLLCPRPGRAAVAPRYAGDSVPSYAESNGGEIPPIPAPSGAAALSPDTPAAVPGDATVAGGDGAAAAPEGSGNAPVKAPAAPPVRLIGTVEFRSLIKNLPKWERVMAEEDARPTFAGDELTMDNPQLQERWKKLRAKLKDAPLMEKIRGVNNFFNQWPYKPDPETWGVADYWATPREFMQKSGDCEDYAIAKFYALINLGVPPERMRIAAVKDGIRGLGHAVLVVFTDDDAYLLDNLTNLVLSHKKLTHYTPQYSVNKDYMWRHVKPKPGTGK